MSRFLCVGEPLVSLTPPPGSTLAATDSAHLGVGGAELNVAIHLARWGIPAAYAGTVGHDPFGDRIRDVLSGEGVDCTELREAPGPTAVYFKEPGPPTRMLYHRAGSAGSLLPPLTPETLVGVDTVHVTGVTFGLRGPIERTARALCAWPRSWQLSFDVNFRPALWTAAEAGPVLLDVARAADVVFVGRDEAAAVWDVAESREILALLNPDAELVVKDDGREVDIWAEGRWWRSTPPPVAIAEPVGAGDAFAAAYLAARSSGCDPIGAAERGHRLAAHVMASVLDQGAPDGDLYRSLAQRSAQRDDVLQ